MSKKPKLASVFSFRKGILVLYPYYADIKIEGNKIQYFEKNDNFTRIRIDGRKIETDQLFLYPGFRDCHGHIYALGKTSLDFDLSKARSEEECIQIISKKIKKNSNWLTGRGWNHENWTINNLPGKESLDKFFKNIPVYLVRVDGHCAWANSFALNLCGIDSDTDNPEGGQIVKNIDGNPTGILLDNAMSLVSRKLPKPSHIEKVSYIKEGMKQLAKFGIIETHDMDVHPELAKIFIGLDERNELKQYIKAYISAQEDEYLKYHITRGKGNSYDIAGIKFYADGSLGSRSAYLADPYDDDPTNRGLKLLTHDKLKSKILKGLSQDFDIAVHCIGDAANEMLARIYEELQTKRYNSEFRIEHAQILNHHLPQKFIDLNLTASIQSIHCISDAYMAERRLGNRVKTSYLWKKLIDLGVNVLPGSDYPIESANPILGIDAFVNRFPFGSEQSWQAQEIIPLEKALELYYSPLSFKCIRDNFILLDKNLFNIDSKDISKAKNKLTLYNGFVTYNDLI